jgi:hypothetical protein
LEKRYKGEKFDSDVLCDPNTFRTDLELLEELKEQENEGYEDIYITSMRNKYAKKDDATELKPEPEQEPEEIIIPINQANTLLFSGDDGTAHILDIQRFIVDFSIQPAVDQTKRANYFPTRKMVYFQAKKK